MSFGTKCWSTRMKFPQQIYDTAVNNANSANATVDARRAAAAEAEDNIRVAQSAPWTRPMPASTRRMLPSSPR